MSLSSDEAKQAIAKAKAARDRIYPDTARLDWWFQCNEKERGHVMALVHCKGLDKRAAIDQVMNVKKEAK